LQLLYQASKGSGAVVKGSQLCIPASASSFSHWLFCFWLLHCLCITWCCGQLLRMYRLVLAHHSFHSVCEAQLGTAMSKPTLFGRQVAIAFGPSLANCCLVQDRRPSHFIHRMCESAAAAVFALILLVEKAHLRLLKLHAKNFRPLLRTFVWHG
jgi:hypothetical protein